MARLDDNGFERGLRIFDKSDEELGRWLAELHRVPLERVACEAVGIDAIYTGRNALAEPAESQRARSLVRYLTNTYLDAALQFDDGAPDALATWLALRGDYERAGRAMRKGKTCAALLAQSKLETGRNRMRATKLGAQIEHIKAWAKVGYAIRSKERGPRMSNSALAREIAKRTGDRMHSIRVELPKIGLDAASWPDPVKPRLRKKTSRKRITFGSLRR